MPRSKSPLFVIFLTVFIDLLGFGIVLPLLPRYAEDFAASDVTIGLLMSSFSAMQFLFAPIWGRLSDRFGRRPILIAGLASSTLFYALFAIACWKSNLMLIFVSRIGAGIAGATIPTAQAFIADTTTPEERGRGMALIGAAFGIGFTFGPLIGAFWVSDTATSSPGAAPGIAASVLSFAAFVVALIVLPESLPKEARGDQARRHLIDIDALKAALDAPTIAMLLGTFFLATFAFSNFEGTLARLTKDTFSFSDRDNFYVFAYVGLILTLAQGLLVRRLLPKLGELKLTVAGALFMTVGLGLIGESASLESFSLAMIALPIAVIGFAALTPSLQSLISLRSANTIQGGVLGITQSSSALARILGPFCGNVLYGLGTHHTVPYFVAAGLMAIALLFALILR